MTITIYGADRPELNFMESKLGYTSRWGYKEAKTLFQSASMNLREGASNSFEFLKYIPECDRISGETMKVPDTIFINGSHNLSFAMTSKSKALHFVSRFYDPRGMFFPTTLNTKLVIQELQKQEKDWDKTFRQSQQQE